MYSEMRQTMCASEKLTLYTDLSYLDFIFENLSSGPSFCKPMALRYAFSFVPRSDGVNASDGTQCPPLGGCWSTLGSNYRIIESFSLEKTFTIIESSR